MGFMISNYHITEKNVKQKKHIVTVNNKAWSKTNYGNLFDVPKGNNLVTIDTRLTPVHVNVLGGGIGKTYKGEKP